MLNRAYQRGFTLIELIITISVLGALLLFAAPNFSQIMKSSRINTVKDELAGLLIMAKSEAVFRNMPVYIHLRELSNIDPTERCLVLSLSDTIIDCTTNAMLVLKGRVFDEVVLEQSYPQNVIKLDAVRGLPELIHSTLDSDSYSEIMKISVEPDKKVALKMHLVGRTYFCSTVGEQYGLKEC